MPARPDALFTGIIGVLRSHRRRKIGTALKVSAIRYAHRLGYRYVHTDNEEHNPMYDLNMQLGSVALPASLYYERQTAPSWPYSQSRPR
jgi:GNAT superfamily N-acetyltransferase